MPIPPEPAPQPKYIPLDRKQMFWAAVDVENLIPAQHPARAIWALVQRLDLSAFEQDYKSWEGQGGRSRWPPQLLVSVLVYAYSEGVSSTRQMERMMDYEPGMRWLCAGEIVNYHSLADFRMEHQPRLEGLFTQVLAVLESEGLIDLGAVMQDGTKVRAVASKESLHRRKTLEEHRERAREAVRQLEAQAQVETGAPALAERRSRSEAARQRAAREKLARMEAALEELERRERETPPAEREQLRVSESEAQARKMKQSDGGWAPSYNVQTTTDAKHKILVAVAVSQDATDVGQLEAAVERVPSQLGRRPGRVVADGGYASRDNVRAMARQGVEFVAPWKPTEERQAGALKRQGIERAFNAAAFAPVEGQDARRCPADKLLLFSRQHRHHGEVCRVYQAAAEDCSACPHQSQCCGTRDSRQVHEVQEGPEMQAYLQRMAQPETQTVYKQRKAVAETPHLWWKTHFGWRQFSVRGLAQAAKEALWLALTYNLKQWTRLCWNSAAVAAR